VGHNDPVTTALAAGLTVLTQTQEPEDFGLKAGSGAFWMFVALAAALVLLVLSMRKQMRRVDFDEKGESDAERMRGSGDPRDDDRQTGA
jgi:hypothetical protein